MHCTRGGADEHTEGVPPRPHRRGGEPRPGGHRCQLHGPALGAVGPRRQPALRALEPLAGAGRLRRQAVDHRGPPRRGPGPGSPRRARPVTEGPRLLHLWPVRRVRDRLALLHAPRARAGLGRPCRLPQRVAAPAAELRGRARLRKGSAGRFPRGQTTALRRRTPIRPTTEITVSITDQDLRVWPTVSPKYSLTSQKPASLTWLKNSEPDPIASTSRETCDVLRSAARPPTMPAVVTVATVADPVARRTPTATSQPSTRGDRLELWAASAITAATPEAERTVLKPPPAATISMIEATPGRPAPSEPCTCARDMPEVAPSDTMATRTPISRAIDGSPMKSRTLRTCEPSLAVRSATALRSMSSTGSTM